jgi:hypothetical protein
MPCARLQVHVSIHVPIARIWARARALKQRWAGRWRVLRSRGTDRRGAQGRCPRPPSPCSICVADAAGEHDERHSPETRVARRRPRRRCCPLRGGSSRWRHRLLAMAVGLLSTLLSRQVWMASAAVGVTITRSPRLGLPPNSTPRLLVTTSAHDRPRPSSPSVSDR